MSKTSQKWKKNKIRGTWLQNAYKLPLHKGDLIQPEKNSPPPQPKKKIQSSNFVYLRHAQWNTFTRRNFFLLFVGGWRGPFQFWLSRVSTYYGFAEYAPFYNYETIFFINNLIIIVKLLYFNFFLNSYFIG